MQTDNVLYWVMYFVVTVLIAWIAFSLILLWFRPALYNANGSVNWWNTLWVAALIILFAWLIMIILMFIVKLFTTTNGCVKPDACDRPIACDRALPCEQPNVKSCDPCDKYGKTRPYNSRVWMD